MQSIKTRIARGRFLLLALLLLCSVALPAAADTVLKKGSGGEAVVALQRKLRQWGYYNGPVDGIFGSQTEAAFDLVGIKHGDDLALSIALIVAQQVAQLLAGYVQTVPGDGLQFVPGEDDVVAVHDEILLL